VSIEILGMICTASIAAIGFYLGYTQGAKTRRRITMVVGFLFAIVSGLLVVEEYVRRTSMATLTQKLERDWIVLKDTPVDAIQFEIMSADGILDPGLLHYAQNVHLDILGVDFGFAVQHTAKNSIDFSHIFTVANLSERGRIGITVAKVKTSENRNKKTIERFRRVDCIASQFITAEILSRGDANRALSNACSATVTITPPNDAIRLGTIADWPKVSMTVVMPEQSRCIGICKNPPLGQHEARTPAR
jgi:hypothetical protein